MTRVAVAVGLGVALLALTGRAPGFDTGLPEGVDVDPPSDTAVNALRAEGLDDAAIEALVEAGLTPSEARAALRAEPPDTGWTGPKDAPPEAHAAEAPPPAAAEAPKPRPPGSTRPARAVPRPAWVPTERAAAPAIRSR